MLFLLGIACLIQIQAYIPQKATITSTAPAVSSFQTTQKKLFHLFSIANDDPVDEYYDMLNLFKPISDEPNAESVFKESSINIDVNSANTKIIPMIKKPKDTKVQWDQWDAFMEEELGDLDPEVTDENKWILEVRDIIEQRRGTTIWSRKSETDVNRELKKAQTAKPLIIPEPAASIITAVYLDQSKKLSEIKKEDLLAFTSFRKFMMDLKKKTKKDPVVLTKLELSKKWLAQKPRVKASSGKNEPPKVIMDEYREPVQGVIFEMPKSTGESSSTTSSSTANAPTSSTPSMKTFSMINWDTPKEKMPPSLVAPLKETAKQEKTENSYTIDNEEIFVAISDDYFVVV